MQAEKKHKSAAAFSEDWAAFSVDQAAFSVDQAAFSLDQAVFREDDVAFSEAEDGVALNETGAFFNETEAAFKFISFSISSSRHSDRPIAFWKCIRKETHQQAWTHVKTIGNFKYAQKPVTIPYRTSRWVYLVLVYTRSI